MSSNTGREAILLRLREPGPDTDELISVLLDLDMKAWTRDFGLAESLVPLEAVYTLSHNDDRSYYWCDVSCGVNNVQGWGRTPACAVAAAGVAYLMDGQLDGSGAASSAGNVSGNNLDSPPDGNPSGSFH